MLTRRVPVCGMRYAVCGVFGRDVKSGIDGVVCQCWFLMVHVYVFSPGDAVRPTGVFERDAARFCWLGD